jgi:hypothetical protein
MSARGGGLKEGQSIEGDQTLALKEGEARHTDWS